MTDRHVDAQDEDAPSEARPTKGSGPHLPSRSMLLAGGAGAALAAASTALVTTPAVRRCDKHPLAESQREALFRWNAVRHQGRSSRRPRRDLGRTEASARRCAAFWTWPV